MTQQVTFVSFVKPVVVRIPVAVARNSMPQLTQIGFVPDQRGNVMAEATGVTTDLVWLRINGTSRVAMAKVLSDVTLLEATRVAIDQAKLSG